MSKRRKSKPPPRQVLQGPLRPKLRPEDLPKDLPTIPPRPGAMIPLPSSVLSWNDGVVSKLAEAIERSGHTADLPILADALEEAGWDHPLLLRLLRTRPDKARWLLDLLFWPGKFKEVFSRLNRTKPEINFDAAHWILDLMLCPDKMTEDTFARDIRRCVVIADLVEGKSSPEQRRCGRR